jgi:hypothetical protein
MECATCGNSLAPGSPFCPRCGASTATAAPAGPNGSASQKEGSVSEGWDDLTYQSGPPRQARTAFYGRYGSRNSFAPPAPSSLTPSITPQLTLPQHSTAASAPTQPGNASAPAAGNPAPASLASGGPALLTSDLAQPSAPARARPRARTQRPLAVRLIALGSILLLIALLVGMGIFGYRAYKNNQAEMRAAATASAHAHATATAITQARATATALLFSDPLSSNANGWMEDGTYSYFQNGQYYLHNPDPAQTFNAYYEGQTFSDFRVQITVTADTNADPNSSVPFAYGLVLRADPTTPSNKFVFFVSPNGTYDFALHDAEGYINNGWTDLIDTPWAKSSAIHTGKGATNTLTVKAVGYTFTLFINGQQIASVSNAPGNTSGWIGVMVEGADMQASFSNLRVYGPGL